MKYYERPPTSTFVMCCVVSRNRFQKNRGHFEKNKNRPLFMKKKLKRIPVAISTDIAVEAVEAV